jgi:hypothetical protein
MHLSDIALLTKKIGVGLAVAIIPLLILVGGIWATHTLLAR